MKKPFVAAFPSFLVPAPSPSFWPLVSVAQYSRQTPFRAARGPAANQQPSPFPENMQSWAWNFSAKASKGVQLKKVTVWLNIILFHCRLWEDIY